MNESFRPSGPLRGRLRVPADKSISHRAAILGAMSAGTVRIRNYLHAGDTTSTLDAVRALGAKVEVRPGEVLIGGCGLRGLCAPAAMIDVGNARAARIDVGNVPAARIDVGNAGTLMRMAPGWLASQEGSSFTLDGDESIRRRPIDRIVEPLTRMGAQIEARDGKFPPFTVHGAPLRGIEYRLPVASAQVKSCVLLAGLATGGTTVVEPAASRDHTERLLLRAGAPVKRIAGSASRGSGVTDGSGDAMEAASEEADGGEGADGVRTTVADVNELGLESVEVPGDLSSAAFLIAAAVLVTGSRVVLEGVGVNWTRAGFLRVAQRMGAVVLGNIEAYGCFGAEEPVAELEIRSGPIAGTTVEASEIPLTIDELPLVALLGCFAQGETIVHGAKELRVKESDRIATVVTGLRGLGAEIEGRADGFVVRGTGRLRGGRLDACGDHRLALLGAVAGLASEEGVEVVGMEVAAVSYPGFADDLTELLS
ncbi:MAG: 3-phosphoshikimate 1-carboxyvinyltransferase [Solirubrobacteraceae bacterium]